MKNNFCWEYFKQSVETNLFKIIFAILVIVGFYSIISCGFEVSYLDKLIMSLTGKYESAFLILIILLSTFNVYNIVESNAFYIIRFKNKEDYLRGFIKNTLFINTIIYILYILITFIFTNLLTDTSINNTLKIYDINNIVYYAFVLFRNYLVFVILSMFNLIILKLENKKMAVLVLNILIIVMTIMMPMSLQRISDVINMPIFIGNYLVMTMYSNLVFEISITFLYMMIQIMIVFILFKLTIKYMKQVGK